MTLPTDQAPPEMPRAVVLREFALWAFVVSLSAAKLWLTNWLVVAGDAHANFDDAHYLRLAAVIREGGWLGPYNALTLIKGPLYPIWIAAVHLLGIPLLVAQRLLCLAACAVFMVALRGLIARRWILAAIFCVLALEPASYLALTSRVVREGIYPALTLFVLASGVGFSTTVRRNAGVQFTWAIALGVSLGAFWLTREEGLWIMPSLIVLAACSVREAICARRDEGLTRLRLRLLAVCLIPIIWISSMSAVSLLNRRHYGVYDIVELKARPFKDAMGALSRVEREGAGRRAGMPAASRECIYEHSPAFRELRPFLEGPVGEHWGQFGDDGGENVAPGFIRWGWFMWAVRSAASRAGHYQTPGTAQAYYTRLAKEINTACREGALDCSRRRSSLIPPVTWQHLPDFASALAGGTFKFLRYHETHVTQLSSAGSPEIVEFYGWLTSSPTAPIAPKMRMVPQRSRIDRARQEILRRVAGVYKFVLPIGSAAGLALLIYGGVSCIARRRFPHPLLVVAAAMLAGVVTRMLLLGFITISAFDAFQTLYLVPGYPLAWAFALCITAASVQDPGTLRAAVSIHEAH